MIVYSLLQKDLQKALQKLGKPVRVLIDKNGIDIHIEEHQKLPNLDRPIEITYTYKQKVKINKKGSDNQKLSQKVLK